MKYNNIYPALERPKALSQPRRILGWLHQPNLHETLVNRDLDYATHAESAMPPMPLMQRQNDHDVAVDPDPGPVPG